MTHDSKAAAYADRVLVIGDGRIRDTIELGRRDVARRHAAHRPARQARPVGRPMSLNRLAVRSLRARPLRATLSVLGVALGVAVLFAGLATNAGVEASVRRAPSATSSAGPTCASPRSARPACRAETRRGDRRDAGRRGRGPRPRAANLPRLGRSSRRRRPPAAGHGARHRPGRRRHSSTTSRSSDGSPLREPAEPSALITERLAAQDGLARRLAADDAGRRRRRHLPGHRHHPGDGPLTGAFGRTVVVPLPTAQAVFGETGVTRVDIGLTGRRRRRRP